MFYPSINFISQILCLLYMLSKKIDARAYGLVSKFTGAHEGATRAADLNPNLN